MTPEQQRSILEAAAKACGVIGEYCEPQEYGPALWVLNSDTYDTEYDYEIGWYWNPINNSADTAEMCAKLEINHEHHSDYIQCLWAPQETYHVITMLKDHDNSRLKAWMFAATMVAAKIGGYKE